MSRNSIHRRRRCYALWTPIAATGAAIYIYSLGLALMPNALSILGLIILSIGAAAAIKETREK